jgi:uncharacterized protein YjbI with pentapeptide repeats
MDTRQRAELWTRLTTGAPLDGLGLATHHGRIDLRDHVAPKPAVVRHRNAGAADVAELGNLIVIRDAHWRGIDFSGASLGSLRFFDSVIEDCCFEGARCRDWRMWGTAIVNATFRSADLQKAALGAVEGNKRNSFRQLDFTEANLRGTVYVSCDMIDCKFVDTKLSKVDFQGTTFTNCVFQGELEEVLFYRQAFRGEGFPANDMKGVDLRHARLRHVEFRGLNMGDVMWPEDADHIIIDDYTAVLDRLLNALTGRTDIASRKLSVILTMKRKWAGPDQKRGVLNKLDLLEAAGSEAVGELMRLIRVSA